MASPQVQPHLASYRAAAWCGELMLFETRSFTSIAVLEVVFKGVSSNCQPGQRPRDSPKARKVGPR